MYFDNLLIRNDTLPLHPSAGQPHFTATNTNLHSDVICNGFMANSM